MPWHMFGNLKITCESHFCPSTMWILRIKVIDLVVMLSPLSPIDTLDGELLEVPALYWSLFGWPPYRLPFLLLIAFVIDKNNKMTMFSLLT